DRSLVGAADPKLRSASVQTREGYPERAGNPRRVGRF
ncbi:hypothetical protein NGA_2091700, partial [Nannochloropsis gaditana CCMP526]